MPPPKFRGQAKAAGGPGARVIPLDGHGITPKVSTPPPPANLDADTNRFYLRMENEILGYHFTKRLPESTQPA